MSHSRQDLGQAPPSPLPSAKEKMEACEPLCYAAECQPVLHGQVSQDLGLGFIFLADPEALNKQLFGVFVCFKKVLLQSVEAKHTPNAPRVLG